MVAQLCWVGAGNHARHTTLTIINTRMSKVIIMSQDKLVNIVAVKRSTPLSQVYATAMQFDDASKAMTEIKDSVFARVRAEARDVHERAMVAVGQDETKLCGKTMRAEFKRVLEAAEQVYCGAEPDRKAKNTWNKNKTDLSRALRLRYPFHEAGEKGSSAISAWCTKEDDRIEALETASVNKDAAKDGDHLSITKHESKDVTVDKSGGDSSGDAAPNAGDKAVASQSGITFADSAQEALFNEVISLMAEISKNDPSELTKFIEGCKTQLSAKAIKVAKAFASKAA